MKLPLMTVTLYIGRFEKGAVLHTIDFPLLLGSRLVLKEGIDHERDHDNTV